MPKDCSINYIELPATDLNAVKEFYAKTFQWEFTDYGPSYAAFTNSSVEGGFTTDATVGQGILVVLYHSNLEGIKEIVEQNGGTITKDIFSFPGGRRFHFKDPSGNELAVWSE